jgi:hypothetical protein
MDAETTKYDWSSIATSRDWTPNLYRLFSALAAWDVATTDKEIDGETKDTAFDDACRYLDSVDFDLAMQELCTDENMKTRALLDATSCFLAKACECATFEERSAFMNSKSSIIRNTWLTLHIDLNY